MDFFNTFKQLLKLSVSDEEVVAKNSLLADTDFAAAISAHIDALTVDHNLRLNTTNVSASSGLLVPDENSREICYDPKGSGKVIQGHLEANINNVVKMWQRSDDADGTATGTPYGTLVDGRRFYITDSSRGVLYLNEHGQILGGVPGFNQPSPGYGVPSSAITFQVGVVEYLAVCSTQDHFIQVYDTSDFSLVSTFGTYGVAGLPSGGDVDSPTDLAFDEATSTLYVSCIAGMPPGGTGTGFVFSLDLTDPALPVFGSYLAVNDGSTLDQGSVVSPMSLFYDSNLSSLWILSVDALNVTRPLEVGALAVTGTAGLGYLNGYLEFRGTDFSVSSLASKLHVDVTRRRLYLTNSPGVEVFDTTSMKHLYTFGGFGQDESSDVPDSGTTLPPTASLVMSVVSDTLTVDGVDINFLLFTDLTNNRVVRVGENLYEGENIVVFTAMEFDVPISLHGYLVKGSLSSSKVIIEYRTSTTGAWQVLSPTDSVPAREWFQFRLKIASDLSDMIQRRAIHEILVVGEQE